MNEIIDKIYRYIEQNNMLTDCERVVVGLSGGADSVCLLMVLKGYIERRRLQTELCAVHVNHGIRQEAGDDEEFARALCERMGVEFMAYHIDAAGLAKQLGMSVEEAGRKERYRIFNEACKGRNARIAVAHHMNDQAETVLMNLSRGTSLKGIGGIRPVRDNIIRPLLSVTRAEVEEVLKGLNQPYVTDATNLCNDYTRNSLRNVVIPYMTEKVNAHTVENIADAAEELQKNFDFIEAEANKAREASRALFSGKGDATHMPATELAADKLTDGKIGVMALLVECGLCASNSEARRLVQQGGVSINDAKVESIDASFDADSLAGEGVIIKKGKKIFHRAFMK